MSESNPLEKRKEKIFNFIRNYKDDFGFLGLILLIFIGFKIRISNLVHLKDITTGKFIPGDPDAAAFLRYAKYILEHGKLMDIDMMRYYPLGYSNLDEFNFLSHFIVYLYKFLHFFNNNITLEYVDVIFPAITFGAALIFFYLLIRKLFDFRVALLASAFLTFMPPFLYRTISGVGDKEALGIVLFFAALYFYILSIKSEYKYGYLHGITSGFFTALLGSVWGGVNFVFLIIGGTVIVKIITDNLEKNYFYSYALWWFTSFILLNRFYNYYYGFQSILVATTAQITTLALISGFIYYMIKEKNIFYLRNRIDPNKYPLGLISFLAVSMFSLIILIIIYKPIFIYDKILNVYIDLTRPFSRNRWALTVAESQQPYVNSWFGQFGDYFIYLTLIGAVFLFYECFKNLKRDKWILSSFFSLFILSFIFSRYSSNSFLDGRSTFSLSLYIGSLIFFTLFILGYFIYGFYKNKEIYEAFKKIDKTYIFILIWFLITAIGARSAIRLFFMFVPATIVLVAYILIKGLDFGLYNKNNLIKVTSAFIVGILIFAPFIEGSLVERGKITFNTAKYSGPSFDQQWQIAMNWVRENTSKDSVFAHWWDYGYWVQTFGERATLSDGGNARGAINHFIGRYLLTGRDRIEALELLKTHNATHVLISSDEIGKYTAFSSIGADENYDRYSYIPTFFMNPEESLEERDENGKEIISYLFKGNFVLDQDFIYKDQLLPKSNSLVAGVILAIRQTEDGQMEFKQPTAIMLYNNNRFDVPLNCIFFNEQEFVFDKPEGYNGCLRIIPVINNDGKANYFGAGLFLSPNTRNTLFTQIYLFDKDGKTHKEWEGFEKIYDDSNSGASLLYHVGANRLIGPIKIWKIYYGEDIKENPIYLSTEPPNPAVERV